MSSGNCCGTGWSCIATKCAAILLISGAVGVADVFVLRKQQLEIIPVTPPPPVPTDGHANEPGKPDQGNKPDEPPKPPQGVEALPPNMISLEQAKELFQRVMSTGDVRFVDARNEDDFIKGRIPTAVNLPPTKFSNVVPPEVDQLSRDATIVIYCGGGECDASKLTALRLNELGFTKTLIFHDGFPAWLKANQPVEK